MLRHAGFRLIVVNFLIMPFKYNRSRRLKTNHSWRNAPRSLSVQRRTATVLPMQAAMRVKVRRHKSVLWNEFINFFERFTDVLVVSAKEGCSDKLEKEYQEVRRWIKRRYYRVSSNLNPYLEQIQGPLRLRPLKPKGKVLRRQLDSIERIFYPATIREMLGNDSGNLISHLSCLSDAIYRCDKDYRKS